MRRRQVWVTLAGTGGALTGQHMNVFEADRLAELEWEVVTLRKRLDALDARQRSTETTARILFCALLLATLVITFRLLN